MRVHQICTRLPIIELQVVEQSIIVWTENLRVELSGQHSDVSPEVNKKELFRHVFRDIKLSCHSEEQAIAITCDL